MSLQPKRSRFLKPGEEDLIASEEIDECPEGAVVSHFASTRQVDQQRQSLPTFKWRSHFLYLLETSRVVVVTGETGSGKSTQLPQYIYEAGWVRGTSKYIAVTQPRRVAAITLAVRVAEEKDCNLGNEVGYLIRFEDCFKPGRTSILYMTDGMLIQEMTRDPLLQNYRVIMLDEVHERSLQVDLLLGLVKKILRKRLHDLRVVVSSATLEAQNFINYFKDLNLRESTVEEGDTRLIPVSHLHVEGRQHPVRIFYLRDPTPCYVTEARKTVFKLHENRPLGADILVFLTSQDEVNRLVSELVDEYRDRKERFVQKQQQTKEKRGGGDRYPPLRSLPLYGGLPAHEQLRVFERPTHAVRTVVVATNVAEASVTLPRIGYVIDCGYARLRAYNADNSLEALVTLPVSKASANQRAGRAGRVRVGEVYRLYTEDAYNHILPRFTAPESQRSDLATSLLRLKTLGVDSLARFDWLPPRPPARHLGQAAEQLVSLGALTVATGMPLTERGTQLSTLCAACGLAQPAAAAALLGAVEEGCTLEVAAIVSLMQLQNVFVTSANYRRTADRSRRVLFGTTAGDHLTELNAFTAYETQASTLNQSELQRWCQSVGLNARALQHALYLRDRILGVLKRSKMPCVAVEPPGNPLPIVRALLRGFFMQVAHLVPSGTHYVTVRGDHALRLHPSCVLYAAPSTSRWPKWILFTRVHLSAPLSDNPAAAVAVSATATCVSGYPQYFPNKIKIVGTGTNRSVAPCEPFYLLDTEWPMTENQITGATNLIEHYGLKNAYQKYFRGNLKDELSGFLPHLSGNVNMPASADDSGLMGLIERPPIRGKELTIFPASQLDPAVRLHTGQLPQEYMALFMAASPPTTSVAPSNGIASTEGTPATPSNVRKRRRDAYRANTGAVASESAIGPSVTTSASASTISAAAANLLLRNPQQQQHHHHHHHPSNAAALAPSVAAAGMAPHSGPLINATAAAAGVSKPATSAGYFATPPPAAAIRRSAEDFSFMPSSGGGGVSSVESPGGDFDDEFRRKRRRKEKKSGGRKERIE
ncbi:putative ATP-dependent RNA helicase DHX35 [Taenia crassiceps]|uniref:ATP-dependent RNA helicase DHX35 n=1 Tax=Taenia crassiceps TaxID=6207 RepID=A0ABR4Q2I4_9CEST